MNRSLKYVFIKCIMYVIDKMNNVEHSARLAHSQRVKQNSKTAMVQSSKLIHIAIILLLLYTDKANGSMCDAFILRIIIKIIFYENCLEELTLI